MSVLRLRTAALALAASISLSACAYDEGYGYGSIGYASDGYYGDYYGGYGGHYAGYGYPGYYGWYDDFYYPGIGVYIYDRGGHRHRWNDRHRKYWEGRRGHGEHRGANWDGFRHRDRQGSWQGNRQGNWSGNRDGGWSRRQSNGDNVSSQAVPQSAYTRPAPAARRESGRSSWRASPSRPQSSRGYYGGRRDRN